MQVNDVAKKQILEESIIIMMEWVIILGVENYHNMNKNIWCCNSCELFKYFINVKFVELQLLLELKWSRLILKKLRKWYAPNIIKEFKSDVLAQLCKWYKALR